MFATTRESARASSGAPTRAWPTLVQPERQLSPLRLGARSSISDASRSSALSGLKEHYGGAVKRLRASVVCEAEGHLLLVRLRDPVSGVEALYPPGGGVEEGEAPEETARRETLEETGLRVRVEPKLEVVDQYPFRWAGVDHEITTHYFAATLEDAFDLSIPQVVDAPYNLGASWMPVGDALQAMSVHPVIASACARVLRLANHTRWKKHPNAAGPASTLLAIHDQFRAGSSRLQLLVEREAEVDLAWVARAFMPLAQTLHHHHHAEEEMLFPLVHRRTGTAPEMLVSDHEALTSAIEAVEASLSAGANKEHAKAAVAHFDEVLVAHLDREESLVIPVLLAMTPDEAWALIHGH
jgi:8-oxo-dGTP pyrophosphatase MutT (NUDIX family)